MNYFFLNMHQFWYISFYDNFHNKIFKFFLLKQSKTVYSQILYIFLFIFLGEIVRYSQIIFRGNFSLLNKINILCI